MKHASYLVMATFLFSSVLTSCDAGKLNAEAEKTANEFYTNLQKKDYKAALALCSSHAFTTDTKDEWNASFERNAGLLGELKSFTKTSGFNIATSTNLGTTISTLYDVVWQYGKSIDSVVLVKEKDGSMKISRYAWDYKEAKFMTEESESEKAAAQYMQAIKSGDYDGATKFCSETVLSQTSKERWAALLQTAPATWGTIADYKILKDSTAYHIGATGDLGKGNYYDVVVQSQRGDNKVMEKMIFFQKNYDEPVKLTGHSFL